MAVVIRDTLDGVDWARAKADLAGRRLRQRPVARGAAARRSRSRSTSSIAHDGDRVVGMARLLSDGVCNAYLIDVWTASSHRRQGIASAMVEHLAERCRASTSACRPTTPQAFYASLGFRPQPAFMSLVAGRWLDNDANR